MKPYLSSYLFGFRKGFSSEQCLIVLIEAWKRALDKNECAGAVLTDLSKAFDCLSHNLLIAKLAAYGFDESSLLYIQGYFFNRKQRTKVKDSFSSWRNVTIGVPQGSVLGPLLFNIFINDLFLFIKHSRIANYADDNTLYSIQNNNKMLVEILEHDISTVLKWFNDNEMKPNEAKSNFLLSKPEDISLKVGNEKIDANTSVKLLGVTIEYKASFAKHINIINR